MNKWDNVNAIWGLPALAAGTVSSNWSIYMERGNAWKKYDAARLVEVEQLADDYKEFISSNKTERECASSALAQARAAGYRSLEEVRASGKALRPGDKVYAQTHGKSVILAQIGTEPLENGMNILGAHIDSPRLDVKQNPLYESDGLVLLDTHYYGGIKKYQWVTMPLAIHGVVVKTDGTSVPVVVGEDASDPVFCVTDLLIHLGSEQLKKEGSKVVEGEALDVLVGGRPSPDAASGGKASDKASDKGATADKTSEHAEADSLATSAPVPTDRAKEPAKAFVLELLHDAYGIDEEDFLSAELEIVPAGRARDLGFDRSMVIGYGQDDRVCAYTSLVAQLAVDKPARTSLTILADKEEIGSVGATGMHSLFFENVMAEICDLAGCKGELALRRCLRNSRMLSSDVSAGVDPGYESVFETKNAAYLGRGVVFNKYTGSRGKSGSNDASAEYVARVRRIMDDANVNFQTAELGKVDAGGGGTIAYILAQYDMDVIDSGVAVLSMHAPWEVTSKADIYEACEAYKAFLRQ
jgi:aspartyl aminopeptidase